MNRNVLALVAVFLVSGSFLSIALSDGPAGASKPADLSSSLLSPAEMRWWAEDVGIEVRAKWDSMASTLQVDVVTHIPVDYQTAFAPHQFPKIPKSAAVRVDNDVYTLHSTEDGTLTGVVPLRQVGSGTQIGVIVSDEIEEVLSGTLTPL
ncbi:MAG: hypothetical protein KF841_03385 [Phycisphaerae bacterium]|nr:hypothetical protein [Phycisphaerae bacterium]